nr:CHAP domain-containing protein [Streptomyces clavuligerus]
MLTDAASSFYHYGQRTAPSTGTPDVGDAVVYGYANGWAQHVAIVTGVSNGVVTITGGNQSPLGQPRGHGLHPLDDLLPGGRTPPGASASAATSRPSSSGPHRRASRSAVPPGRSPVSRT